MKLSTVLLHRGILAAGITVGLALASAAGAQGTSTPQQTQQQNQQQTPPAQQQTPATTPSTSTPNSGSSTDMPAAPISPGATALEAPKADPAEESAYKSFSGLNPDDEDKKSPPHGGDADRDKQIKMGEDFVAKYPLSGHDLQVYTQLVQDYYQKNQIDKMLTSADMALKLDGDDVSVLVLVGWVIPHSTNGNDPEGSQKLDVAEKYEKHALELLPNLPKPAGLTDDQFAQVKKQAASEAHSGLGLIYFRRSDLANSVTELQQSTSTATSVDPTDFYVMGIDLMQLKRYSEAVDAFQKCAAVPSGLANNCTQRLDQAKKAAAAAPPAPQPKQ
jgi:tetratricopeptide (TPR) repeat protein